MTDEKKVLHDKPLDKMTVTELRDIAKEIDGITGVHGMKKPELLEVVKEAMGIKDETPKKPAGKPKPKETVTVQELKTLIKTLRAQRNEALANKDKKMAKIYRRRISRLKKKTRQVALPLPG
jgi:excinuclease UvrABC helicase subunit UvrB